MVRLGVPFKKSTIEVPSGSTTISLVVTKRVGKLCLADKRQVQCFRPHLNFQHQPFKKVPGLTFIIIRLACMQGKLLIAPELLFDTGTASRIWCEHHTNMWWRSWRRVHEALEALNNFCLECSRRKEKNDFVFIIKSHYLVLPAVYLIRRLGREIGPIILRSCYLLLLFF